MKNPTPSTGNSIPRFAKNSQGFCVNARGECFATLFDPADNGAYFGRSLPQNFVVGSHKIASSATWRVILQTSGPVLPASDAILWRGDAILPTSRVILRTVGAILCTVGGILRRFSDIFGTITAFSCSEGTQRTEGTEGTEAFFSLVALLFVLPDALTPLFLNY